ncbi:hypothetical protein L915_13578 [Phytophthora nicotianae]|uniref:Uncharacterized protein n=1 Tax=Phytophthora nicotianae TaxID=4792 RepID=W2GD08_PHYNI|nr:hypothetical protein L915_13578 [Phytophthora nicotianae]
MVPTKGLDVVLNDRKNTTRIECSRAIAIIYTIMGGRKPPSFRLQKMNHQRFGKA